MSITSSMPKASSVRGRRHHDARRRRADGAGQDGLDVLHQLGVGGEADHRRRAGLSRVRRELLVCPRRTQEARHQRAPTRAPPPSPATGGPSCASPVRPKTSTKSSGLAVLHRALVAPQRQTDVEADVHQHAPDERVRDLVEAPRARRAARAAATPTPKRSLVEEAGGQPARARERRQEQRVQPHREAAAEPGQGAGARAALPEEPAQDGRTRTARQPRTRSGRWRPGRTPRPPPRSTGSPATG